MNSIDSKMDNKNYDSAKTYTTSLPEYNSMSVKNKLAKFCIKKNELHYNKYDYLWNEAHQFILWFRKLTVPLLDVSVLN